MKGRFEASYNERLFSGGVRGYIHGARFHWLAAQISLLNCSADKVLELGCFDGKAIDYLPQKPRVYKGFDANFEGGLELAAKKWHGHPNYRFHFAREPADMRLGSERFDMAIAMETLEHVDPEVVEPYLQEIARHLDGYFFVTVPNEKGLVFLAKWLGKRLFTKDHNEYTLADVFRHTAGKLENVQRREHKGFDYAVLVKQITKYFDVISVSAVPFGFLSPSMSYGAGIVAKSR